MEDAKFVGSNGARFVNLNARVVWGLVKLVNLSLMAKWKWRLLQEDLPLWKVVLREKYGENISGFTPGDGIRWPSFAFGWWKELMSLEEGVGENWFSSRVVRKVSNGRKTRFWEDKWIGDEVLALTFPRLYSISLHKEANVGDLWSLVDGGVSWNLGWRIQLFLWESNLIANLLARIEGTLLGEEEDKWLWTPEEEGIFSVRSSYKVLEELVFLEDGLNELEEGVFANLWKSQTPSKVVTFS